MPESQRKRLPKRYSRFFGWTHLEANDGYLDGVRISGEFTYSDVEQFARASEKQQVMALFYLRRQLSDKMQLANVDIASAIISSALALAAIALTIAVAYNLKGVDIPSLATVVFGIIGTIALPFAAVGCTLIVRIWSRNAELAARIAAYEEARSLVARHQSAPALGEPGGSYWLRMRGVRRRAVLVSIEADRPGGAANDLAVPMTEGVEPAPQASTPGTSGR